MRSTREDWAVNLSARRLTYAVGIAEAQCAHCQGLGYREVYKSHFRVTCDCVYRAVFRACLNRYRDCDASGTQFGTTSWEFMSGGRCLGRYSMKREEFKADFYILAAKALDPLELKILRLYFMARLTWKQCLPYVGLSRGNFFHRVYVVQRKCGKAFAETEPYPLYPMDEYFGYLGFKR